MSDSIRFVLDGEVREIPSVRPTRTVLQYLREDLGRTGTKEGCAEGDCGACTVVLADAAGGRLRYRAVNACIQFLPTLDGRALFTVESLKRGDALHPVQQALADGHGAQCGFCTPGFVMSMFALYKTDPSPDRAAINDALAGNLCRCTGYRPIVDAAQAMYGLARRLPAAEHDHLTAPAGLHSSAAEVAEQRLLAMLRGLRRSRGLSMTHPEGAFHAPRSLAEFARLREAHPDARILAGGTDVGLWVTKQHRVLGDLLYIGNVEELATASVRDGCIDIGAAVPLADVHRILAEHFPDWDEMMRRFASPPIRNAGTLCGNVANGSPIGDSMPNLIALGTIVVLRKGGATRELPLEDLYLAYQKTAMQPGEFVERVRVSLPTPGLAFRSYKISKRFDQDISAVCGAFALWLSDGRIERARVAFGGMAATPKRAGHCEAELTGQPWDEATLARAVAALERDYAPITDMRASGAYRLQVARNLLKKCHLETAAGLDRAATRLTALELTGGTA
jgi:xanthine dehydrogenase small subunit